MTDKILSANDDEFRQPDLMLAVVTATIFGVSALLFPMMICGCHFHAIAVLPTLTPLFWSLDPAKGYFLRRQWMRRGDRIDSTISRIAPQRCATGFENLESIQPLRIPLHSALLGLRTGQGSTA